MIIDISKLKYDEFLELEHEYNPKNLNLELYDLHYREPLRLEGRLERVRTSLFFKGTLRSGFEILCTRCLKPVNQKVKETFDLYYPYTGQETIDATDDIREVMLLSYPVKFLCKESCKGLCPQCGANWNEESCRCPRVEKKTGPGAFDKLKEWYSQKKGKKE
ncbi:MAG: DUF177 domain-containing protein [Candidatus Omnitrophica bacterium]|nr:DUF177 domain-containing protein [Candidatus Omnitrophota bacterium]